mmetsp:Transcript_3379/g.9447  ORF Transcript_3379/g.9447 Transcript_3379/m.9447 type:complete len:236 (-) Transcript_3379:133-840(-)
MEGSPAAPGHRPAYQPPAPLSARDHLVRDVPLVVAPLGKSFDLQALRYVHGGGALAIPLLDPILLAALFRFLLDLHGLEVGLGQPKPLLLGRLPPTSLPTTALDALILVGARPSQAHLLRLRVLRLARHLLALLRRKGITILSLPHPHHASLLHPSPSSQTLPTTNTVVKTFDRTIKRKTARRTFAASTFLRRFGSTSYAVPTESNNPLEPCSCPAVNGSSARLFQANPGAKMFK